MSHAPIHVTLYRGAQRPEPVRQDDFADWPEFVEALADIVQQPTGAAEGASADQQKLEMLAFSPHRLRRPYRAKANVEDVTLAVLDLDEGVDLATLALRIDELGIAAVIYGSPSDDPDGTRKLRVVAPVSRPIGVDECERTRFAFAEMLGFDDRCGVERSKDAAKLFFAGRMHGSPEREWIEATGTPLDVDALLATPLRHAWGAGGAAPKPSAQVDRTDERIARAVEVAERMPASVEHRGGERALYAAAREIAAQLGDDEAGIETVLKEVFNPRCLPPWPDSKLHYEARKTAEWQRKPEQKYAFRKEERRLAAAAEVEAFRSPDDGQSADLDPWDTPLRFDAPDEPIDYFCEGLKIAPSKGKITVIAGQPGAGKGPTANYLAVCFALGLRAFDRFDCQRKRTMILDYEGARLTLRRCRRLANGLGFDPSDLQDELIVYDGNTLGYLGEEYTLTRLEAKIRALGVEVLIVDSYITANLASGLDPNAPGFANLAKALAQLGICVIVIAHANKASAKEDRKPRLSDIAYTGAFAALAQTAIVMHKPSDDENTIMVGCARAPEEGFAEFSIRFAGHGDEPLTVRLLDEGEAGPRRDPEVAKMKRNLAEASKNADRALELMRQIAPVGMTPKKAQQSLGISAREWGEAYTELMRRDAVRSSTLSTDKDITLVLASEARTPPKPGTYTGLPRPGDVARRSRE